MSTMMKVRNTFIIFLVSGFWHGANWTFIIWGFLNALYIMPSILLKTNRNNLNIVATGKLFPDLKETGLILLTFCLTVFAWIFFRAENVQQALKIINEIFSNSLFTTPEYQPKSLLLFLLFFLIVEWFGRMHQFAIACFGAGWPKPIRWSFYIILLFFIFECAGSNKRFIYFQF